MQPGRRDEAARPGERQVKDSTPIDRGSFEPPYAQLARAIRERIARGDYRSGARLPSEAELCAAFQVSPMTVRRAIGELVREDVVVTEHGRGTFVKPPQLAAATFDLDDLMRYLASPDIEARITEARIVSARAAGRGEARRRGGRPRHQHQTAPAARRGAGLLPQRVPRLRSGAPAGRGRAGDDGAAGPLLRRLRLGPQVRAPHAARLRLHRARGGAAGRRARHAGLGARAPLLRLRRPPGELGPVRRPRRPDELHDHRGRRRPQGRSVTP